VDPQHHKDLVHIFKELNVDFQAVQFAVNSTSPFLRLPIAKMPGTYLKGLFDTGGCCIMGDLSYHMAIKTRYPQLVKQVVELDTFGYAPINIGGIDGSSVKITHILTYHLPYTSAGGEHPLRHTIHHQSGSTAD
jgi:hypothetical protein